VSEPLLAITGITKRYGALRPLRIDRLLVAPADRIALIGFDQPAAEVLINLITGGSLPDTGEVVVFGRPTAQIADSADWLATLDRFGIVSDRAALLEPLSVIQNLAMPFSLEIEPPPPDVRRDAEALAHEAGLGHARWERPVGELDPASRLLLRVARALALQPSILILEHPSATLDRTLVTLAARAIRTIVANRGIASLTLTMDAEFAGAVADRVLTVAPATGAITEKRAGRMGFRS
jgi:ABC-type transporter Mla maintaining outer membrane lipid asymmetry ATPase subunit MlaF